MTELFHKALTIKLKTGQKFKIESLSEGITAMELLYWMNVDKDLIEYSTFNVPIKLRTSEEIAETFAERQIERIRKDSI